MAKSTPVRRTKLAYVDSVVKPPRSVAKQQASNVFLLYKLSSYYWFEYKFKLLINKT